MRRKKIKKYIYEGLGFPVILKNVPVIKMQGEEVLDINFNALQKAVAFMSQRESSDRK